MVAIAGTALAQAPPNVIDAGGGHVAATGAFADTSLGGIVGPSSTDAQEGVVKAGFIGQVYEVTNLVVIATPSVLLAGETSQLTGTALLDDGTVLELSGDEIVWDPPVHPIESITAAGVVTAAEVVSYKQGTVTGAYRGVRGSAVIEVLSAPAVTTLAATDVAPDANGLRATLNGTVNPSSLPTAAWFEWGTSTAYGEVTAAVDVGQGTVALAQSARLSGLASEVTYHFRLVATNSVGRAEGLDSVFGLKTIEVTTLADDGPGSLRQAVAEAGAGFTITFGVTGTIVLTNGEVVINKALTILGPGATSLTISGNGNSRIFAIGDVEVTLADLTLADGRAPEGGAIFSLGQLSLDRCRLMRNTATAGRGGAIAAGGFLRISATTFNENQAAGDGGAIDTRNLGLEVTDSLFVGNRTGGIGGAIAAGVEVPPSPITLAGLGRSTTYTRVSLNGTGATFAVVSPGETVSFQADYTTAYIAGGAGCPGCLTQHYLGVSGVFADCHDLGVRADTSGTIDRRFTAPDRPGVYYITQTPTWWYYCGQFGTPRFANRPEDAVAVLIVGQPTISVGNCTMSGNAAESSGGAVASDWAAVFELTNGTVTDNTAGDGGGLSVVATPGEIRLRNTLVAGNHASSAPDVAGALRSLGFNLIGDASGLTGELASSDLTGVDPELDPLGDNGGATLTHALRLGSPAIDAGDNAAVAVLDQRGYPRRSGATALPRVDIGAYELQFPAITPVADQVVLEDDSAGPLAFTVSDAEWAETSLRVEAASSNTDLLPGTGMSLEGTDSDRTVTVRPAPDQWGETVVTLRVINPLGAASATQFRLTVESVNDAPSFSLSTGRVEVLINAGPQVFPAFARDLSAGPPNEANQSVGFPELANTNPLLFAADGAPALRADGTLHMTALPDAYGRAELTAVLIDSGGADRGGTNTSPPSAFVVDVVTPPIIAIQPLSQTNMAGSTVYLSVVADANPLPAYQWLFEGLPILNATNAVLVLPNVQSAKAGTYQVLVWNRIGMVESTPAVLGVAPLELAPRVVQEPADAQIPVGGTLVLSVVAEGSTPLTYQWRRNGMNLIDADTLTNAPPALLWHGAVSGATTSELRIAPFQPADAGSYHVVVQNGLGIIESRTASVRLAEDALPYDDRLTGARAPLQPTGGLGTAETRGFGTEPGEPLHADRPGGASAWFTWTSPSDGVASFCTAGSDFDTLLAVYLEASAGGLTPVAADDDTGGALTSYLRFNARAGMTYQVAVDDRQGLGGSVVLGWSFEVDKRVPVISEQPAPRLVTNLIQEVVFRVELAVDANTEFRWLRNDRELSDDSHYSGTRSRVLRVLPRLGPEDVGLYTVALRNLGAGSDPTDLPVYSAPAVLEMALGAGGIGTPANVNTNIPSQNKFEDLVLSVRTNLPSGRRGVALLSGGGSAAASGGTVISSTFRANREAGEPEVAGVIGGASRWYYLPVTNATLLTVETTGSTFDTLLAVYSVTNLAEAALTNLTFVAADDNSAPDGTNALVRFLSQPNRFYFAVVDGRGGANGVLSLGWREAPGPAGDNFRWIVCQSAMNGVIVFDTVASGIGKVYLVYTGTDYSNMADVLFATEEESGLVRFPAVAGRQYLVLADAANGNPSSIHPVWTVRPAEPLGIGLSAGRVHLFHQAPQAVLQTAPSVKGPWFDVAIPARRQDGVLISPVAPVAPVQLFRLIPGR